MPLCLCGLLFCGFAHAAAPTLDFLFPAGGRPGTTVSVEAGGKQDPWPPKVWTDFPGLELKPEAEKGKFSITVGKNVPYGPHLIRLYNEEGASDLHTFVVGRQPELLEKEPNDAFKKPQPLEEIPVTINGRLDKSGDVDSFAFKVEAGKWIVAAVDAYSIGSPIDAYLHLLDENGVQVALGNDSYNLDPVLAYKVEKSGTYTLQISGFVNPPQAEVRFAGGNSTIYRLTITDGPFIRHAFAVKGDSPDAIQVLGYNLRSKPDDSPMVADKKLLDNPRVENRLRAAIGSLPEQAEHEPNHTIEQAQNIVVPGGVNGCLQTVGEEDRFAFTARKGERYQFRLSSGTLGFPVTAVLRVEDDKGKQLARDEMSVTLQDPDIAWTAPSDGKFILAVSDLYRHGGPDCLYRLEALPQIPSFSGKTDNHKYRLDPGKTIDIKVTVARSNGQSDKIVISAKDLPEGVTAREVEAPSGKGEAKLTLTATEDAKPASCPIRILLSTTGDKVTSKPATFDFRAKDAKTGDYLVNETDNIWLTVAPKGAAPAAPAAKKKKK